MERVTTLTCEQHLRLLENLGRDAVESRMMSLREMCNPSTSTAMFLDLDFRPVLHADMQHVEAVLAATIRALHASIQEICDIDAIILVARTENGNGAHLHAVDRVWAKVIVTPSRTDAIIENVLRRSGVDPGTVDRRVTSLRILGASKSEAR